MIPITFDSARAIFREVYNPFSFISPMSDIKFTILGTYGNIIDADEITIIHIGNSYQGYRYILEGRTSHLVE